MGKKFRKVESAADKAVRLKNEELLFTFKSNLNNDADKVKAFWKDLSVMDNNTKVDRVNQYLVEALTACKSIIVEGTEFKYDTPNTAKLITDITTKANKLKVILEKEIGDDKRYGDKEIKRKFHAPRHELITMFERLESGIRRDYDDIEKMLNIIVFNVDQDLSFNDANKLALAKEYVTYQEFVLLKTFNLIRNFVVHNLSSSTIIDIALSDNMMMFKATFIEVAKLHLVLIRKYSSRMLFYFNVHQSKYGSDVEPITKEKFDEFVETVGAIEDVAGIKPLDYQEIEKAFNLK